MCSPRALHPYPFVFLISSIKEIFYFLLYFCFRERSMDILVSLQSNSSIAWCGISDTMIGPLKPGDSIYIPLCLIPLDSGLIVSKIPD